MRRGGQSSAAPLTDQEWNITNYATRNDLSPAIRGRMIALLNRQLADAIDLGLQLKHAHWNVRGPHFIALHELFDRIATDMSDYADSLAERASQLGGIATGTVQQVAGASRLPAYPAAIAAGNAHLAALTTAFGVFGASARSAIAESGDDADTADLFTEISRGSDKLLWLLEAHLHAGSK